MVPLVKAEQHSAHVQPTPDGDAGRVGLGENVAGY